MTTAIVISVIILFIIVYASKAGDQNQYFENIGVITSMFNKGFSLTGGLTATTRDTAFKNALIVGPSGSGKTSTVLIGTLNAIARGRSSLCILDVSGEIFTLMSGYLSKEYKIYRIDFTENSDGFNPITSCHSFSDVQKIASIIIKNSATESKSDPYWTASAENLISIFMQYLIEFVPADMQTMSNLVYMIETFAGEPEKIDRCFSRSKGNLLTSYKALIRTPDKTLQSTISTALTALKLFKNPDVARCSSKSTFDFEKFRSEKSVLFINTKIMDVNFLAPFSALLFEQLFKVVLSRIPKKSECAIFCVLDEMVTMRFQNLGLVFSNIRKYKGGCIGIVQDERMLEMSYSSAEADAIRTNSFSKVYLPGQPHQTCKMLEEMIGKDENHKPVMAASDIRTSEDSIILVGNMKPFKVKMIPYFNHWILSSRTKYPEYRMDKKMLIENPLLLTL